MGLMDKLRSDAMGELSNLEKEGLPTAISDALAKTKYGSLQGLVDHLEQTPLAGHVESWIGNGANRPVAPDQLRAVLDNEHVRKLAEHFGVDPDTVLKLFAKHLPDTVSKAAQQGTVTSNSPAKQG